MNKKIKIQVLDKGKGKNLEQKIKEKNFCFVCGCFQGSNPHPGQSPG